MIPCKECNNHDGMTLVGVINQKAETYLYQCDRCKSIEIVNHKQLTQKPE